MMFVRFFLSGPPCILISVKYGANEDIIGPFSIPNLVLIGEDGGIEAPEF